MMRLSSIRLLAALLVPLGSPAFAQTDVAGVWQGRLVVPSGGELILRFDLSRNPEGSYSAVLDAFSAGEARQAPASTVTVSGNRLAFDVSDFSGSYEGIYDGAAAIEGQWKQEGASLPLDFTRIDQESGSALTGDWQGEIKTPVGTSSIGFRFVEADGGRVSGYIVDINTGMRSRMTDVEFSDGKLSFQQPAMQLQYEATITGPLMSGTWTQNQMGQETSYSLAMTRESFEFPVTPLALSDEDMMKVAGTWRAESGDAEGVTLLLETTTEGEHVGYIDLPAFSLAGVPVSTASFSDGKLSIRSDALDSGYTGELVSRELQGEWTYPGGGFPLILSRQ